jgi:hypothetical protein
VLKSRLANRLLAVAPVRVAPSPWRPWESVCSLLLASQPCPVVTTTATTTVAGVVRCDMIVSLILNILEDLFPGRTLVILALVYIGLHFIGVPVVDWSVSLVEPYLPTWTFDPDNFLDGLV